MRLWELPTFAERGELSAVHDARALTAGSAAGLLVSGDKHGAVKVCFPCGIAAALHAIGLEWVSWTSPVTVISLVCSLSPACSIFAQPACSAGE